MALVCMLYSCETKYYINVIITHVKGINTATMDAISCFQATLFRHLAPHAVPMPGVIPVWPAQFSNDSSATINH